MSVKNGPSGATGLPNINDVIVYFQELQDDICQKFTEFDPGAVRLEDNWRHDSGGGGETRVFENGEVIEKGGVNFSHVKGDKMPKSASAGREPMAGLPFEAAGVSLVIHPLNPFVPTSHMNVRFFIVGSDTDDPVWWFGGGYDLTPFYGFTEDCEHWHTVARSACEQFDPSIYPVLKKQCDDYFYIEHRNEARGIGGLFFDDLNESGFLDTFRFVRAVGDSYLDAYMPLVEKRRNTPYTDVNRKFQLYRRGRYVEFNLVYDRGTLFGLQSRGRTESILMSLPPSVEWKYNWRAEPGSEEEKLADYFLVPRNWADMDSG